jgi:hypothetical protein
MEKDFMTELEDLVNKYYPSGECIITSYLDVLYEGEQEIKIIAYPTKKQLKAWRKTFTKIEDEPDPLFLEYSHNRNL